MRVSRGSVAVSMATLVFVIFIGGTWRLVCPRRRLSVRMIR